MPHNFHFLEEKWEVLAKVGETAERNVYQNPNVAISELRKFAETITKYILALEDIREERGTDQQERLRALFYDQIIPKEIYDLLNVIRQKGNKAVHEPSYGEVHEAKALLQMAFRIGVWFMEVYGDWSFQAPEYIEPAPQSAISADELNEVVKSYEEKLAQLETELEKIRKQQIYTSSEEKQKRREYSQRVAANLELTEAETRLLIDQQLRDAGWEADSETIRFSKGARPEKGKNMAIAEWPLKKGYADYALFVGLELVGIIEAKRASKDIPSDIEQAKEYAKLAVSHGNEVIHEPWGDYFVPFLFATNGRPYFKQLEQKSGIWFLDARKSTNHPRPLQGWYTPKGLQKLLEKDVERSEQFLRDEKFDYLKLRDYQVNAIQAVEKALEEKKRSILVAMATGTGKTRMAIGLIYRLLKAKRFNRILFLVDRKALGEQAESAFKESKMESFHTFTEIYSLQSLYEQKPDPDTKVHIATVQGMLKRIFYNDKTEDIPPIDQYDCIIVDEAHRGYTLDKEMSEMEIEIRDHHDYVSKYRKVLDYFDAVRIGLTATPALHTTEIFGPPVFTYSYREAVVDGYLVDHEPPYQFETVLKREGITWAKGEKVDVYDTVSGTISQEYLEDEVNIEVAHFNTKVITESFNRVIIRELTNYISPDDEGKTLIFAATDDHADLVVRLLKEEFAHVYGEVEDNAIMKITGSIKDPSAAIRRFKNEKYPTIVVTVDLLTTGVDIPSITNLVFLRRVRSRILYEQMLGRATRRCEEIRKDHFNIFDAVGIYEALKPYTSMKPVVARPNISLVQLVEELEGFEKTEHLQHQREQMIAKIQRKKRQWLDKQYQDFKVLSGGKTVDEFIDWVKSLSPTELSVQLKEYMSMFRYIDENRDRENKQYISTHEDELIGVKRGYGNAEKPDDYLQSFGEFIRSNMNQIPALTIVCQRPTELTREELKKLLLELDQKGFSEKKLQAAWREAKNEDIAADIIAFIRQQALGDPLISHEERIKNAMKKIYQMKAWPPVQKKWLERIEKQLLQESVLHPDPEKAFEYEPFKNHGGFKQLNRIFNGELAEIVREINHNLYNYQQQKENA
ncbi:type I restriction-modification system endonuclease [Anoxybacillus rupiensis]|uniref:Type I restriction-modification system endonuclease n=1 Tax=Anoxybacteroides rupiense TaxID=311460 RepID=A0ABT5W8R6_9BACL|nr:MULTISPECIES: type I restriction-modification system endonuclease [Anoxybacillus]MDE8565709.1 type I restriction-modification system endonuclease [Anoxybacillus rupiensis]QHC05734.1 type I restriction-modification system endonuclease [Anoxybacillus sp. PDR2]